ncbi:MAG TPA: hypothetical protein VHY33_01590 [Thermoanaerobaculia bacterium]|nr:hypothetical protein [Thermoanaerobaculia bacterium]
MSRAMVAEYDAAENTLRLVEPLKGVSDHAKVRISIETDEDFDPVARLASLNAPTADIEQMIAETLAGRR